ncbi:MAG: hypothetical protein U1E05_13500, partial [Patescibacteria group bacterium]|nr:hypothetical protein [Patescibacteria group bacterium]
LDALQAGIADSDETDYDRRAVLLHAMAAAGNGNFSLVNRLHRDRAQLSPTALAYLALAFVEMDRNDTAAEVLGLLEDQDLDKEPAESQGATHRSHSSVELRAVCLLVLLKIAPDSPQIATRAEWLLSQRSSARWQAGGAMGPAVVALARWQAKRDGQDKPAEQVERAGQAKPFSLAIVVNGRELRRLELAANGPTQVVDVPADLLAGDSTEVRFLTDAEASYAWQCLLDGYIPLDNAKAAAGAQVVRKVCQPAPRMLDGRELPRGFGILAGNYTQFTNPLTQLPVEHRAVVELYVRRLSGSDATASRPEYCVITDPIPAGTRVVEQSITGPIERFEVTPAGIVFHLVHSDRVAVIRYELVAEAEGTYEAGPALLRHANRGGGLLSAGGSLKIEVLPPGETSTDPYRFTPEELYALGKHHFGKQEYEQAEQHLRELVDQWNVRPQVYRDAIQMLLDAYLAIGPVAKMVDTFEIVITRWPEKEITFDQLL